MNITSEAPLSVAPALMMCTAGGFDLWGGAPEELNGLSVRLLGSSLAGQPQWLLPLLIRNKVQTQTGNCG